MNKILKSRRTNARVWATDTESYPSTLTEQIRSILAGPWYGPQQVSVFMLELAEPVAQCSAQEACAPRAKHQVTDIVLGRLGQCLRETDIVGRAPCGRIAIVPASAHNCRQSAALAERVLEAAGRTGYVATAGTFWRPSVGIARYPADASELPDILSAASHACARAGQLGGNQYSFYATELNVIASVPSILASTARTAVGHASSSA